MDCNLTHHNLLHYADLIERLAERTTDEKSSRALSLAAGVLRTLSPAGIRVSRMDGRGVLWNDRAHAAEKRLDELERRVRDVVEWLGE